MSELLRNALGYEMSREQEQQLVQRWVDAVHTEQALDEADYEEFNKRLNELESFFGFYDEELKWPEFRTTDEFGFCAISLDHFVSDCRKQELDDDEIAHSFRTWNDAEREGHSSCFYLREVCAGDGRSAWVLVKARIFGQGGPKEKMVGLFATPLAAEVHLRADGYVFTEEVPSGKTDAFTDEQIIEMVQSRRVDNAALARADWFGD